MNANSSEMPSQVGSSPTITTMPSTKQASARRDGRLHVLVALVERLVGLVELAAQDEAVEVPERRAEDEHAEARRR